MRFAIAGLYARVPLLARAQDQRQRACKALAAARASGPEGSQKVKLSAHHNPDVTYTPMVDAFLRT